MVSIWLFSSPVIMSERAMVGGGGGVVRESEALSSLETRQPWTRPSPWPSPHRGRGDRSLPIKRPLKYPRGGATRPHPEGAGGACPYGLGSDHERAWDCFFPSARPGRCCSSGPSRRGGVCVSPHVRRPRAPRVRRRGGGPRRRRPPARPRGAPARHPPRDAPPARRGAQPPPVRAAGPVGTLLLSGRPRPPATYTGPHRPRERVRLPPGGDPRLEPRGLRGAARSVGGARGRPGPGPAPKPGVDGPVPRERPRVRRWRGVSAAARPRPPSADAVARFHRLLARRRRASAVARVRSASVRLAAGAAMAAGPSVGCTPPASRWGPRHVGEHVTVRVGGLGPASRVLRVLPGRRAAARGQQ